MAGVVEYITEGTRIVASSLRNRIAAKKYEGTAEQICQQIIKDCWNGRFFQTSTNNFKQFWTRDFGWCVQSLMSLKYEKEVQATLRYAMNRFIKYQKVTTTITPLGRAYDFPVPAVDSLPWFIHCLKIGKFPYYSYKNFLNKEIAKFFNYFIDPQTGLVKPELHVSSMKDFSVRKSSCYDNCLVALLAHDLNEIKKLDNPFQKYDYPSLIKRHFWSGEFFFDDLTKKSYLAGDANVFPFLFHLCKDKEMLQSVIEKIKAAGLDQPFPLKYTVSREGVNFIAQEVFFRNYESNSIWTHLGPLFIKLVQQADKESAKQYKEKYRELIEKHQNYLEVFTAEGKPFSSVAYYSDSGMLWAANYLTL